MTLALDKLEKWRAERDHENRIANSRTKSRQMLRRDLFKSEYAEVAEKLAVPRPERRKIARARAKRAYAGLFLRGV